MSWTQSVPGCPVSYGLTDEFRTAIDSVKQTVISFTSTETIDTNTPWSQQSANFATFEAEVKVQSSEVSTLDQ